MPVRDRSIEKVFAFRVVAVAERLVKLAVFAKRPQTGDTAKPAGGRRSPVGC
jgi:hypothetical protein